MHFIVLGHFFVVAILLSIIVLLAALESTVKIIMKNNPSIVRTIKYIFHYIHGNVSFSPFSYLSRLFLCGSLFCNLNFTKCILSVWAHVCVRSGTHVAQKWFTFR